MNCGKCKRVLVFSEEFAHLSEHGREEGMCNSCFSAKKESAEIQSYPPAKFNCYKCGKPIQFQNGIAYDMGTTYLHPCLIKNRVNSEPRQQTVTFASSKAEEPEEVEQIGIPEKLLFPLKKIPSGNPIIDEIKKGQEERSLAILSYEHEEHDVPGKRQLDKLSSNLDPKIIQGLKNYGFGEGVLEFQDKSFQAILSAENTVISAPTGSGKTEAFAVPIIQKICNENYPEGVFALLVYPLRALARDQIKKIQRLIECCKLEDKITAFQVLGGMTSDDVTRRLEAAKGKSIIIATNFDVINWALTLVSKKWKKFFEPAKVIAIDELHSYTSFHGANVYHLIKRMKRHMKRKDHREVQFIGSSATLHNAQKFFETICGLDPHTSEYIKSDVGREQNIHKFFIWPLKFPQRVTMEKIAEICHENQLYPEDRKKKSRQLIFSNTHNEAEFLATNIENSKSKMLIDVHRGGMIQNARDQTEIKLQNGDIDGISCTPTLELGIDIGTVDVAISSYKTEYDTFIQRSGRAGREGNESYAFCVFNPNDASCHYYSRNMDGYKNQQHEIEISTNNPIISNKHEEAAKRELYSVNNPRDKYHRHLPFLKKMSMRGSGGKITIYLNKKKIGEREIPIGYYNLHQDAIYHMNKKVYKVGATYVHDGTECVDLKESSEKNKATRPIVNFILTKPLNPDEKYGEIKINRTITGYYKGDFNKPRDEWDKYDQGKREQVSGFSTTEIDEPLEDSEKKDWKDFSWSSTHMAVKIKLPSKFIPPKDLQDKEDPRIHTIAHVFANAAKIVAKCEAVDIEALSAPGVIYLYDNTNEGANGVCQIISENMEKVLETCKKLLDDCDCDKQEKPDSDGCVKCIFTTGFCSTNNNKLDKKKAREFFEVFRI